MEMQEVCCFQEKSSDEFHARLSAAMESTGRSYEIIFVNDGSSDATWEHLKAIFEQDPRVSACANLFRNAGQAAAMTAGFKEARGRHYIFIDSDLQLDPAGLPLLIAKHDEGYDVVSGYRVNRRDSLSRIVPSKIANAIMRKVSRSNLREFGCTFKIYDARLIRAFDYGPHRSWRSAYVIAQAQRIAEVPVTHYPRKYDKSGWTFRSLFACTMDDLVGMTDRSLQLLSLASLFLAALFFVRIALAWAVELSILSEIANGPILNELTMAALVLRPCSPSSASIRFAAKTPSRSTPSTLSARSCADRATGSGSDASGRPHKGAESLHEA